MIVNSSHSIFSRGIPSSVKTKPEARLKSTINPANSKFCGVFNYSRVVHLLVLGVQKSKYLKSKDTRFEQVLLHRFKSLKKMRKQIRSLHEFQYRQSEGENLVEELQISL